MGSSQSKFIDYSCYELGLTWTPNCSAAATEVFICSFIESIKVYAPVYTVGKFSVDI